MLFVFGTSGAPSPTGVNIFIVHPLTHQQIQIYPICRLDPSVHLNPVFHSTPQFFADARCDGGGVQLHELADGSEVAAGDG